MPSQNCLSARRADAKQSETDYENLRAEVKVLNQIIERLQGVEADNQRMAAEAERLRWAHEALHQVCIRWQSRSSTLQAGLAWSPASVHALGSAPSPVGGWPETFVQCADRMLLQRTCCNQEDPLQDTSGTYMQPAASAGRAI